MPDDDGPEIDFVVGEGEWSADEVLPEPPRREWPWLHRARGPLAVGAGFVVAIAVVATLISSQHDSRPSAAPDPSPSAVHPTIPTFSPGSLYYSEVPIGTPLPVGSGPGRFTVRVPIPANGGRGLIVRSNVIFVPAGSPVVINLAPPADPSACASGVTCLRTTSVPAAVLAAVRDAFPGARRGAAENVVAFPDGVRAKLRYRQVRAHLAHLDILVRVDAPGSTKHPTGEPKPAAGYRRTSLSVVTGGYQVQVEVDAPPGPAPSRDALRKLASDRRLVVDT